MDHELYKQSQRTHILLGKVFAFFVALVSVALLDRERSEITKAEHQVYTHVTNAARPP
jgi:hypothetical protein